MNIGIVGLGLIGGSLGRSIIKNTSHAVFGFDRDEGAMIKAEMLQAINEHLTDGKVKELDLLILALPLNATLKALDYYVPLLKSGSCVIDCCGNKKRVCDKMEELQKIYPDVSFVGVHPMAGREFSGISHSTATLFEKSYIIFTPVHTPIEVLDGLKKLFLSLKVEGVVMSNPTLHDEIIAYTSQLAHVVSAAYVKSPNAERHVGYSAGSFKDMTRVAKLEPNMWTELFLDNRDNLLREIDILLKNIKDIRDAIESGSEERLKELLTESVERKERVEQLRRMGLNEKSKS